MDTRPPTTSRSKEMGSRGVLADQEAGTMVAQPGSVTPGTDTTISRSMSRYRATRRNPPPTYPVSPPKIPQSQGQEPEKRPVRGLPETNGDSSRQALDASKGPEIRSRRRAQSLAVAGPNRDRPARDETNQPDLVPRSKADKMTSIERSKHDAVKDEREIVKAAFAQPYPFDSRDLGDTGIISRLGQNTGQSTRQRQEEEGRGEGHGPRPMYGRSVRSQDDVTPSSRPFLPRQTTKEKVGLFSQRMERQVPRPQAFEKSNSRAELKRMISGPIPIESNATAASPPREVEDPAVTPRFDAPISAVNAGSRMVRVKFEGTEVSVPITPSSTPIDVIRATARQISESIDERSTVVLESFKQVGLERPLRKYEHIRDILNSWDYDSQNTLVVVTSPTGGNDDDLDAKNVSKSQPGETTVYLYYSQKPGHWDKRWVTLQSNGQMLVSKKNGGETANICHLSDFDIYIPTPRYSSKKIKPPKKVCFAVKSQQKSSMFISTANFVHFFSTSDRQLATSWYKAVQEWRSWYLVNVMGEGQKAQRTSKDQKEAFGSTTAQKQHHPSANTATRTQPQPVISTSPKRYPTTKVPPPRKLTKDPLTNAPTTHLPGPSMNQQPAKPDPLPDPFAPTSLLGQTYTQRQKAQEYSSHENQVPPLPSSTIAQPPTSTFPHSTSHNNNSFLAATAGASTDSKFKRTSTTRRRANTQHQMPKPLIDLTPQYQPPPQHMRKGRGVKPEQVPAGGLIEVATSPEAAIQIPPSRDWRRPGMAGGGNLSPSKGR